MPYLSHEEYKTMGGTAEQTAFDILEMKARKKIDYYTQNRLVNVADEDINDTVKYLMYDLIKLDESVNKQNISSASNDGVSITYADNAEIRAKIEELIKFYLSDETTADGIPLLYAGVV